MSADRVDVLGLTKREYFAALAMQGLSAADSCKSLTFGKVAEYAVKQADCLLAALEAKPEVSSD